MSFRRLQAVSLAALVVVVLVGPPYLPRYYLDVSSRILELAIFAMSLDILLGYTGLWSLGHAAFFGVAAYGVGLVSLKLTTDPWIGVVLALAATMLVAAIFGVLLLRARGVYFMMLSLALAQMVWGVAFEWRSLTQGDDGLPGIPRPDLTAIGLNTTDPRTFYTMVAVIFLIAAGLMFVFTRSSFGYSLQGIRDNELRMRSLGYNVWLHQYAAFMVSAFFAGWSGILVAYHNGIVSPDDLGILRSAEALLMVVLGGAGTVLGPVLGAAVVELLRDLVSIYTERWMSVLGIVYVLTVLFAPNGVYNSFWGARRSAREAAPGVPRAGWSRWLALPRWR